MARIVVIGSGVVGQATGKGFAEKGHAVRFVDIDSATIEKLCSAGLVAMTVSEVDWDDVDIVMLAVLTPTVDGRVVLDYIETAALDVGRGLATTDNFVTVVVRSTVPPTTTEKHIAPILERASGKQLGQGFGLAMNPEFLRAASNEQDFARPWITVVGANDARTAATMDELYRPFGAAVVHCTPTEAEMIKYVNNVYNAVKISYFNEVHAICAKVGLDGHLVGAADTEAFLQFARGLGVGHLMLESTIEVNRRLKSSVPAVPSPDKIDAVLDAVRRRGGALEEPEKLLLAVGKSTPTIL
ncbi:Putative UDP-glucose/GDP-mannose dehydrogenase, NAD(P)-binding domain superfamily [Colletotrichum destructivum]|uniref:UDP-glucose/GDP-mannose dehydrogenase, NAD(P)-binding domain superfamily n=1 Tax=Colletotrichum destructivum TaxID=34406 RepID=A0AAX4J2T2_9PEZI|nr:Putative UDP-glucose/GDP-mannose dehydrogenase, NAD(P)-binding domain superfamily [Colletotrichum destructivum]